MQRQRMQNLIDQVARDKTDSKNKETLKRMQQKTAMLNAVQTEQKRKDELNRVEKIEREQLLRSAMENDAEHLKREGENRQEHARRLKEMHD